MHSAAGVYCLAVPRDLAHCCANLVPHLLTTTGEDVPLFYVLSISRVGLPLALLCLTVVLHVTVYACGCNADTLDRAADRAVAIVDKRAPSVVRRLSSSPIKAKKKELRRWTVAKEQLGNLSHRVWGRRPSDALDSLRSGALRI